MRLIIALLFTTFAFGQNYKDDISIVQYSAKFLVEKEISLKKLKSFNTHTFYMSEHKEYFTEENIEYLPTICVYNNGEEVLRIHGGMSLELPDDTLKQVINKVDELQANKF